MTARRTMRDGRLVRRERAPRRGPRGALTRLAGVLAAGAVAAALPRVLPARIVALRMWMLARINGDEGIPIPGPLVGPDRFKQVYADPAANGRSRGAALSDLFWYWLSPGPEVHQEHLEAGPRYDEVAQCTRRILSLPTEEVERLATAYTAETCAALAGRTRPAPVRLRDLMMPVWAGVFTEVVFGARCDRELRDMVVAHADDVVTALKCCGLRHMGRRHRLTWHLAHRLEQVPHPLPASLSPWEQALYLQGTFFNTAVVQMSEATAHLLMVLAHHPALQADIAAHPGDRRRLDNVMDETMRCYPLFGVAHRIASGDIAVDERTTLPAGSVLCFSYPDFHRAGVDDPHRFDPGRWDDLSTRDANHIPYGVAANRPCPAWRLAPIALRAATREILRHHELLSSAGHTRSLPNRGPCLLVPRGTPRPRSLRLTLAHQRTRDRWEDVWRSLVQLVLGSYMVWDARRQRVCGRYFDAADSGRGAGVGPVGDEAVSGRSSVTA
jgi:Cytochrome P450